MKICFLSFYFLGCNKEIYELSCKRYTLLHRSYLFISFQWAIYSVMTIPLNNRILEFLLYCFITQYFFFQIQKTRMILDDNDFWALFIYCFILWSTFEYHFLYIICFCRWVKRNFYYTNINVSMSKYLKSGRKWDAAKRVVSTFKLTIFWFASCG